MANYKKTFYFVLIKYFPNEQKTLESKINAAFELMEKDVSFAKTSPNPVDRRMEIAAYFLSTIKILDEKSIDYETIRKIIIEIAEEYVRPKNHFQAFLKKLPAKLVNTFLGKWLVNYLKNKAKIQTNQMGFRVNFITEKEETLGLGYGFDILECGICKLFKRYNYEKYNSILCEVDNITSNLAGLRLIRTGTIANGAKICDFRFQKIDT